MWGDSVASGAQCAAKGAVRGRVLTAILDPDRVIGLVGHPADGALRALLGLLDPALDLELVLSARRSISACMNSEVRSSPMPL
jgi:hypothetical protein